MEWIFLGIDIIGKFIVFFLKRKSILLGLTYQPKTRILQHINNKCTVREFLIENGYSELINELRNKKVNLNGTIKILKKHGVKFTISKNFFTPRIAQIKEDRLILKNEGNGWIKLNKSKAGAIGNSNYLWSSKDAVKKEALKYKKKSHFEKGSPGAFKAAKKRGWMNYCCRHMKVIKKENGYWNRNKEEVVKLAKKCKNKTEFARKYKSAYAAAIREGYLESICSHMEKKEATKGYWSRERIVSEMANYESIGEINKNNKKLKAAISTHFRKIKDIDKRNIERKKLYSIFSS